MPQAPVLELPAELAGLEWHNVLTGERHAPAGHLAIGQLLACFPVALLTSEVES